MYICRVRKINWYVGYLPALLLRIGIVLLFYFFSRIIFLAINADLLLSEGNREGFGYWFQLITGAIRFDMVAIALINTPYLFFSLLPFSFRANGRYQHLIQLVLFYVPNMLAFGFDYIDVVYSRFTQKRMTFDVFRFVGGEDGIISLLPPFIRDYWYLFLLYAGMMVLFVFINNKIKIKEKYWDKAYMKFSFPHLMIFFGLMAGFLVASRGGFQLRPVSIVTASHYAAPRHYSLVLNTPFTLIKTIGRPGIDRKSYFNEQERKNLYEPVYQPFLKGSFTPKNVVVIVLEGFSLEYSSHLNPRREKSLTPVLDSIGKMGIMLPAYSNGTRSMEGIPAVLAGMPTWMNSEYLTSNYSENRITSLPSLLKEKGYCSAFFHGGKNGTMNFSSFTRIAEFDYYYGKNEYNNDRHYDGTWGIFDDYYLPYCADQLDTLPSPFFAGIFTLSSHHPYTLPSHYLEQHPVGERSMTESVQYADWALGLFFKAAAEKEWFTNTLFVITSDHAFSYSDDPLYQTRMGRYAIPFVLYSPGGQLPEACRPFAQQVDILPTVLDLLHYPERSFSFGKSLFDTLAPSWAVNYLNGTYQMITEKYVWIYDGEELCAVYDREADPFMKENRKEEILLPHEEPDFLKAVMQTYNNGLIENRLTVKKYP